VEVLTLALLAGRELVDEPQPEPTSTAINSEHANDRRRAITLRKSAPALLLGGHQLD
jgi:hypothetical protein